MTHNTPQEISTRRALEIVLSRVRLHPYATDALKRALASEIRREAYEEKPDPNYQDRDSLYAALYLIEDDLKNIDHLFTKKHMLGRLDSASKRIRALIAALEKETADE